MDTCLSIIVGSRGGKRSATFGPCSLWDACTLQSAPCCYHTVVVEILALCIPKISVVSTQTPQGDPSEYLHHYLCLPPLLPGISHLLLLVRHITFGVSCDLSSVRFSWELLWASSKCWYLQLFCPAVLSPGVAGSLNVLVHSIFGDWKGKVSSSSLLSKGNRFGNKMYFFCKNGSPFWTLLSRIHHWISFK